MVVAPGEELLSVKQVAEQTGLPPSTIRYYDQQFEDYLGVRRGPGRRRLFSPQAVQRLMEVHRLLKEEGLSLRQARRLLLEGAPSPAAGGLQEYRAEVQALRAEVQELRQQVEALKEIQRRTLALVESLTSP